ncbi:hypothetical protein [Aeromicrobium sp.]|uniref:hypothetical protein n=1 Tax=Aeromicrobium sp. TaxID=1871063 RepID=UPI0030BC966E
MSTTPTPPEGGDQTTGPAGYPVHPGTPQDQPGRSAALVDQPPSIRLAVRLMWAGAALSLIGLIVTFATLGTLKDQLRDSLEKSDANYSQADFDAIYTATLAFAVVLSLVTTGIWLWMAWKNGQGRSWARIVATVLGGLSVVSTIYAVAAGTSTGASIVVSVVSLLLSIAILVLLWRKESSNFYAERSRPQVG